MIFNNKEKKNLICFIKNNRFLKANFKNMQNFCTKKEKNFMILMMLEMK